MKYLTTTLILGLVGTVSFSLAEDAKPGAGRGDGSFFKKMDTDGDQAISKEEAGERWERLSRLDKDEDNKVTMKEMMAAARGPGDRPGPGAPGGKPGERPEPGAMFSRADKNGDGKITKDEVPEQVWERMGKLDKDGDNAISSEEAKAGRPPGPGGKPGEGGPGRGGEMLKRMDKNNDGNISKDEVPEQAWERLGRLDKDKNGSISKEEMAAGMMAMRGEGKGKGPGPGGPGAGGPGGGPGAMFSRFDKDEDGKLSESEVPAEMWSKLRKADSDADGLVSKEELGKVYGAREKSKDKPAPKKDEAEKKDTAA